MKHLLLTISATALLLVGQSTTAFEQINSENGYDAAFSNGWVSADTASKLDIVVPAYRSSPSNGFEQVNSENGYDTAFSNGWVSPGTASANLDLVKPSFRSIPSDRQGQFADVLSINYISTH